MRIWAHARDNCTTIWNNKMTRLAGHWPGPARNRFRPHVLAGFIAGDHHRGELSVYIAAIGGRVPAIYVPSGNQRPDQHKELIRLDQLIELRPALLSVPGMFRG